jgi:threonine-phosphate decarboxylase
VKWKKKSTSLWRRSGLANPCKQKRFVSHGGDVWGFARKYNIPLEKVLDFSGPVNFLGPAPKAVEAVQRYARLIRFYPDPNPVEFRTKISKYLGNGVDPANIILGNGSIELIYMITEACPCGCKAVIPIPSFTEYEKAALRVGDEPIFVKLPDDFALDVESVKKAVTEDTRMVFICNPHSPSGTLYNKETVLELLEFCRGKNVIVSVDENYIEFSEEGQNNTMVGYVKRYENLFVIRSVTKFYGMPGIRLGYGIAQEDLIDTLQTVRQPWSINSLAGYATLAAFKDTAFIENTKCTIAGERAKFAKMLSEIDGLHVFPSVTNFLLVKILNEKITATKLKEVLSKDGLLIRDCSTFMGLDNRYFRVTVRAFTENLTLVKALKKAVGR